MACSACSCRMAVSSDSFRGRRDGAGAQPPSRYAPGSHDHVARAVAADAPIRAEPYGHGMPPRCGFSGDGRDPSSLPTRRPSGVPAQPSPPVALSTISYSRSRNVTSARISGQRSAASVNVTFRPLPVACKVVARADRRDPCSHRPLYHVRPRAHEPRQGAVDLRCPQRVVALCALAQGSASETRLHSGSVLPATRTDASLPRCLRTTASDAPVPSTRNLSRARAKASATCSPPGRSCALSPSNQIPIRSLLQGEVADAAW